MASRPTPCARLALVLVGLLALTTPAAAQTSLGFAQPDSVGNLRDYRLPTWGYLRWDIDGTLAGNGRQGGESEDNQVRMQLGTSLLRYRETEDMTAEVRARGSGGLTWSERFFNPEGIDQQFANWNRQLSARYDLHGTLRRYVAGNLAVVAAAGHDLVYQDRSERNDAERERSYARAVGGSAELGASLGRIRDVTPLLRAERLAERLVALGGPVRRLPSCEPWPPSSPRSTATACSTTAPTAGSGSRSWRRWPANGRSPPTRSTTWVTFWPRTSGCAGRDGGWS